MNSKRSQPRQSAVKSSRATALGRQVGSELAQFLAYVPHTSGAAFRPEQRGRFGFQRIVFVPWGLTAPSLNNPTGAVSRARAGA